MSYQVQPVAI